MFSICPLLLNHIISTSKCLCPYIAFSAEFLEMKILEIDTNPYK